MPTIAELVATRADDRAPGLLFEGRSWTWAEVAHECAVRAAMLRATRRRDRTVPRRRAARQRARVRLPARRCRARGRRGRRHQPDPAGRGARARHPPHRLRARRHRGRAPAAPRRPRPRDRRRPDRHRRIGHVARLVRRARATRRSRAELPGPETLFVLIFTSGSTGAPKAVRGTQGRFARMGARMPFGPDDVLYCAMPLFHGNALASNFVPALTSGADDRAAAPVLGVGVLRRPAPRRRDVLQHRRPRAVVRARHAAVARRPRPPRQVRARARVVAGRRGRVPRTLRHPARRRLRLERGRDHHHAGARRQAGRARRARGRGRRRRRRPRDRRRVPARRVRRARPAA